jgi:hypothetical protein
MEGSPVYTKILYMRHDQGESLVVDFGQIGISAKGGILMITMVYIVIWVA